MGKTMELETVCPRCGFVNRYHSYKKSSQLKGERRMKCKRCPKTFKVLTQRKSKVAKTRKNDDRPFGWQKYSKSD